MSCDVGEAMESLENECWKMNCNVGEATESLENELCSFSKLPIAPPTSWLIFEPFPRFTYFTAHPPTLPLLRLRHSLCSNPSFSSPTSQDFHLRHLASRPWFYRGFPLSSRQMLGWIFITTIHLTIILQIHIS